MIIVFQNEPDAGLGPVAPFAQVIVDGVERGYVGWVDERFDGTTGEKYQDAGWRAQLHYGADGKLLDTCPRTLCGSQRQAERAMLRMLAGQWR